MSGTIDARRSTRAAMSSAPPSSRRPAWCSRPRPERCARPRPAGYLDRALLGVACWTVRRLRARGRCRPRLLVAAGLVQVIDGDAYLETTPGTKILLPGVADAPPPRPDAWRRSRLLVEGSRSPRRVPRPGPACPDAPCSSPASAPIDYVRGRPEDHASARRRSSSHLLGVEILLPMPVRGLDAADWCAGVARSPASVKHPATPGCSPAAAGGVARHPSTLALARAWLLGELDAEVALPVTVVCDGLGLDADRPRRRRRPRAVGACVAAPPRREPARDVWRHEQAGPPRGPPGQRGDAPLDFASESGARDLTA